MLRVAPFYFDNMDLQTLINGESNLLFRTKLNGMLQALITGTEGANAIWAKIRTLVAEDETLQGSIDTLVIDLNNQLNDANDYTDTKVAALKTLINSIDGNFYGFYANSTSLPTGTVTGYAYVATATEGEYTIWNYIGSTLHWVDSGLTKITTTSDVPLVVNLTNTSGVYSADKTSAEIVTAFGTKSLIVFKYVNGTNVTKWIVSTSESSAVKIVAYNNSSILTYQSGTISFTDVSDNVRFAKNNTGATVAKGKLVYISGSTGENPLFLLATNTDYNSAARTWGMTYESINNNAVGRIIHFGIIENIDTSAYTAGTELWLGVNGEYTNIRPTSPSFQTSIGMVIRQHATIGSIFVNMRYVNIEGIRSQNTNTSPSSKLFDDTLNNSKYYVDDKTINIISKNIPTGTISTLFNLSGIFNINDEINIQIKSASFLKQHSLYVSFAFNGNVLEANVSNLGPNDTSVEYIEINHQISHQINQIILYCEDVVVSDDMELIVTKKNTDGYYLSQKITSEYNNRINDNYKLGGSYDYNYTTANTDVFAFERVLNKHGIVYARLVTTASINNATIFNEGVSAGISLSKDKWTKIDTTSFTLFAIYLNMATASDVYLEWVQDSELIQFARKPKSNILYVGKGDEYDYQTVQDAIDNANDRFDNPVTIIVTPGNYAMPIYTQAEFLAKTPYRYLSIIGTDKNQCILYNNIGAYGNDSNNVFHDSSVIKMSGRVYISNLTIKSEHTEDNDTYGDSRYKSYALHFDSNAVLDSIIEVNNCIVSNSHGCCVGFGINANQKIKLINCEFESTFIDGSSMFQGTIWGHDLPYDGNYYERLIIRNCYIKSNNKGLVILGNYGKEVIATLINNTFEVSGDKLVLSPTDKIVLDTINHGNNL